MNIQKKALGLAGFAAAAAVGLSLATATTAQAELIGPGCSGYAEQVPTGPGSVAGMAQDPVAVAASNNPLLTTLTAAVSGKLNPDVNLVDTLNGGQFTVFAPTDSAFAKIDPATIEKLKTDAPSADEDPDLPRGARAGQPRAGRRHAKDRAGRQRHGHRRRQRPQGQQRVGGLRWRPNRQRHGLHDRHGADAPSQLDSGTTEYARSPAVVVGLQAFSFTYG